METFLTNFVIISVIALIATGASILWRTSIYTRGAIFRPLGRIFDLWILKGCLPTATLWDKILRFTAYPLGRCIYCSSFHIGYYVFFIINYQFNLGFGMKWLLILLPLVHLFVLIAVKLVIHNNPDMEIDDWSYIDRDTTKIFDLRRRASKWRRPNPLTQLESPLTKEEEDDLEACKTGTHHKYLTSP